MSVLQKAKAAYEEAEKKLRDQQKGIEDRLNMLSGAVFADSSLTSIHLADLREDFINLDAIRTAYHAARIRYQEFNDAFMDGVAEGVKKGI